jgi:hypothetical protein
MGVLQQLHVGPLSDAAPEPCLLVKSGQGSPSSSSVFLLGASAILRGRLHALTRAREQSALARRRRREASAASSSVADAPKLIRFAPVDPAKKTSEATTAEDSTGYAH